METPQTNDQRLTPRRLVTHLPAIALVLFAAFAMAPINAQDIDQCGFDTDADGTYEEDEGDRVDVEFHAGETRTNKTLPQFITTDCEEAAHVQLRIYEGIGDDVSSSSIALPATGHIDLGPTTDPDSVQLEVLGSPGARYINVDGPDLLFDTASTAWLIAPREYTLRALTLGEPNLGELELTVVVLRTKLTAPTAFVGAAESPTNIHLNFLGDDTQVATHYDIEWRAAGSDTLVGSARIADNGAEPPRNHYYTIGDLEPNTDYNVRVRSYRKDGTDNDYNYRVSDWVDCAQNPVRTIALGDETNPVPLRVSEGQSETYNMSRWIVISTYRPESTTYTIDIDSGNDAVFTALHILNTDDDITNDIIRITGESEGQSTLNIEITTSDDHVIQATIPVTVLDNAAPVFSVTSVTLDWDIENVGTDFAINVTADFVSGEIDADDADELTYSMTGQDYQNTDYFEIDEDTGNITVPDDIDDDDLNRLSTGQEFELVVTVTDPADQSDKMTIYVQVIEGLADRPFRTTGSADEIWVTPLSASTNGGTERTDVTKSFENRDGGQLCFRIEDEGFTVDGVDQTTNISIGSNSVDVDTVADFSLTGSNNCPRGQVKVTMELPSYDSSSDQFALLGYHGVITVWASVTAYQRGNSASASDDPVKIRIDLVYGSNAAPSIRAVAKVTGSTTYYTNSAYIVDEGDDINLTFTADDPSPTGDRLCWSQEGDCSPCKGAEDVEVYNAARGGVVVERRASHNVTNVSHEYELTVRGTEYGIFGSNVPVVNTDYESNPGGYAINLCATDLTGETHKLKFVVRIENVEEPPVIVGIDDLYFLSGDYAQTVDLTDLTVDGDGNGDIVDYDAGIVGTSDVVTVEESNGIVTVTPTEDDVTGTQSTEIEVTATDSSGAVATQTFFAHVRSTNRIPRFSGGLSALSYELEENAKVGTNVGTSIEATDPDGDDVSYELSGDVEYFRVVTSNDGGQIKVKKAGIDYETGDEVHNLVLTAADTYGGASAINVAITILDVNEPPRATADEIPDQRVLVGVTECVVKASEHFEDPDSGSANLALNIAASSTRPGEVSVEVRDNEDVCITGERAGTNPARITVTATDQEGNSVFKRFRATAEQNNPPTIVGDGIPDQEVQYDGRSDDIDLNEYFNDGDASYEEELSYEFSVAATGIITVVIKEDHYLRIYGDEAGETNVTVTATDQNNQSIAHIFAVEVVRNDPPIAHHDAIADVETRIGLTVDPIDASDAFTDEGDTFELDVSTDDANVATTAIDYDDDDRPWINVYLHAPGITRATLKATDTAGQSAEVSFSIDVGARNDPPMLVNEIEDVTIEIDDRADIELDDVFEDESTLTYEIENEDEDVADVIYRSNSNTLRIWANRVGTTDVTVTAYDNLDQSASDTFTVTVTDPPPDNLPPTILAQINDQTVTVGSPEFLSIDGNFTDPDGDELVYLVESDDLGIATASLDTLDVTLAGVAPGKALVRVVATDPAGLSAMDVFSVTVKTVPTIAMQIDDVTLQVGGDSVSLNVDEYFIDDDGDDLSYTYTIDGTAATATYQAPVLSLTPYVYGTTVVTVTASDPTGLSVSQSFNAMVSNTEIKAVGNEALASVGRQMITSVATAIGARVENSESDGNIFSRVIGAKPRPRDPAVNQPSIADTPSPAPTPSPQVATKPVFDAPAEPKAPTKSRTRDVFSKVVKPKNFADLKIRDLIPQNFATSLTSPDAKFKLSIWGNANQQEVSSSQYTTNSLSTFFGADVRPSEELMLGLSVFQNDAESDYSWGTAERQLQTETTTFLPYGSFQVTPTTLVWGAFGIGSGEANVRNGDTVIDESDLSVRLGHFAVKSQFGQTQGIDLSFKGDLSFANLSTDAGDGEAQGLDTTVDRIRLGIAGSYAIPLDWDGSISPFGELAYRRDGGDGATGSGVEFIGGLRVASKNFSIDARGHTMATYSEDDYEESGFSLLAVYNPTPGEQGLSLSFTPSWGQTTQTQTTLWRETATVGQLPFGAGLGLSHGRTLNTNVSYGFPINHDQHMFKPFIEFSKNAQELRTILLGAELKPLLPTSMLFNLNFIFGRVDESPDESKSHLGVNALLKF